MAVAAAVAVAIALLAAVTTRGRAPVAAGPNTVGVIDGGHDRISAVVTGVGWPGGIACGADAVWVTDSADNMLLRVNSARQVIDRIPVGHGPAGVTVADGEVWVANEHLAGMWLRTVSGGHFCRRGHRGRGNVSVTVLRHCRNGVTDQCAA
jgi:DNA-binding beta-propeller fold protein YncE